MLTLFSASWVERQSDSVTDTPEEAAKQDVYVALREKRYEKIYLYKLYHFFIADLLMIKTLKLLSLFYCDPLF